ncbi:MAG TPA: hypothetical protein VNC78_07955 [Actinomycetota bacterium]|nr:hypothetical protein [Actinomycetota bacterium]
MNNSIGVELTAGQAGLVECYDRLAEILGNDADLAPFERRNALKALAALWQVANGLDMDRGHIYHLGA